MRPDASPSPRKLPQVFQVAKCHWRPAQLTLPTQDTQRFGRQCSWERDVHERLHMEAPPSPLTILAGLLSLRNERKIIAGFIEMRLLARCTNVITEREKSVAQSRIAVGLHALLFFFCCSRCVPKCCTGLECRSQRGMS